MDAAPHSVPYRRIGTILVDRQLISGRQLELALTEQQETGRPLGEICVERYGLDRLSLADALAEQWEEMQQAAPPAGESDAAVADHDLGESSAQEISAEDELRTLLEEAQAARVELAVKTDELGKRLAALEALVVGVSDALAELRPAASHGATTGRNHPKRARGGTRSARRARSSGSA